MNFYEAMIKLIEGKKITHANHPVFKGYYWIIENGKINEYDKKDDRHTGCPSKYSIERWHELTDSWEEYVKKPKVYYKDLKPGQKFIYPDSENSPVKVKIDIERKHVRLSDGSVYEAQGDIDTKEVILVE